MRVVSASEAASIVASGDTVLVGGSGGGHAVPEALLIALSERFVGTASPTGITLLHPVGLGDEDTQGVGRLAHPGLVKRVVTGTLIDSPELGRMAEQDLIEAYTLPQGALSQLMREMASGRPGLLTHVGLRTFIDPRFGGGRQSASATDDLVELVKLGGEEWLWYKPFRVDICFLRGTTADEDGNITMEQEAVFGEMLSMAQATRRNGGTVIVQVRRLAARSTLPAKSVKIPGILVDLVVVAPDQRQTYATEFSPAFSGELRIPASEVPRLQLDARKVIARRAAMELFSGAVCNLGSGISTSIALVASEEGIADAVVLTNEQGLIGGLPASGTDAGAAINYAAMIDQPYQFDFYDGGGLDLAFLSFAEVDQAGNVNVSRFGNRIIGVGGFVNISQNARKAVFSGTFTTGGADVRVHDGRLDIRREGRHQKFVSDVEQVSFSALLSAERGQDRMYITERAVFRGTDVGLELVEVAPGVDIQRDVIDRMAFRPVVRAEPSLMDSRLFAADPMGIAKAVMERGGRRIPARLAPLRS